MDKKQYRYRTWLPAILPGFLNGENGKKFVQSIAVWADCHIQATKDSVKNWFASTAAQDALPLLARDRLLSGIPGESPEQLRQRILRAWDDWIAAGTGKQLEAALRAVDPYYYALTNIGTPGRLQYVSAGTDNAGVARVIIWQSGWSASYLSSIYSPVIRKFKSAHVSVTLTIFESGYYDFTGLWGDENAVWSADGIDQQGNMRFWSAGSIFSLPTEFIIT